MLKSSGQITIIKEMSEWYMDELFHQHNLLITE